MNKNLLQHYSLVPTHSKLDKIVNKLVGIVPCSSTLSKYCTYKWLMSSITSKYQLSTVIILSFYFFITFDIKRYKNLPNRHCL